jgi:hypothetical protein
VYILVAQPTCASPSLLRDLKACAIHIIDRELGRLTDVLYRSVAQFSRAPAIEDTPLGLRLNSLRVDEVGCDRLRIPSIRKRAEHSLLPPTVV